ncbi:hypothetical protein [Chryseobacterium sp.]|uniref:hypothetical protein n=1 Tax=Chryseobacterium sp. TaxID=1871047 RepID=UPI0023F3C633|nr:hypothetical protein [Chryseobacterium sp.]
MIDTQIVKEIIEKEISTDFEMSNYYDTEKYIIIFWKHKKYDADDERGIIVGPGPILFDKQSKEYRLLGSAEWFYGDYADAIPRTEESEEHWKDYNYIMGLLDDEENNAGYTELLIENIKQKIVKRKFANYEEIDFLSILTGARRYKSPFDPQNFGENYHDAVILTFDNTIAQKKLVEIWKSIDFKYEIISPTELLLWKIKAA